MSGSAGADPNRRLLAAQASSVLLQRCAEVIKQLISGNVAIGVLVGQTAEAGGDVPGEQAMPSLWIDQSLLSITATGAPRCGFEPFAESGRPGCPRGPPCRGGPQRQPGRRSTGSLITTRALRAPRKRGNR